MGTDNTSLREVTALDWIAVALAAGVALELFVAPFWIGPAFAGMFVDFGSNQALPGLTQLVLDGWPSIAAGIVTLGLLLLGLTGRRSLVVRRILIVASFLTGLALAGLYLYALYLPIFALASFVEA